MLTCSECQSQQFTNANSLITHLRIVHLCASYRCGEINCSKVFQYAPRFKKHILKAHAENIQAPQTVTLTDEDNHLNIQPFDVTETANVSAPKTTISKNQDHHLNIQPFDETQSDEEELLSGNIHEGSCFEELPETNHIISAIKNRVYHFYANYIAKAL